jgi:glycerol-3-phosphate dehydrogenase
LARRTRLAFLDKVAAMQAVPVVSDLLAKELGWDSEKALEDMQEANDYIR